jgi:hypothetical protein
MKTEDDLELEVESIISSNEDKVTVIHRMIRYIESRDKDILDRIEKLIKETCDYLEDYSECNLNSDCLFIEFENRIKKLRKSEENDTTARNKETVQRTD